MTDSVRCTWLTLDDRPYVVPTNYVYDGAAIYAASGRGQKIDAMRTRPRVCLEVDEVDGSAAWRSVIARGVYEELTDDSQRRAALSRLGLVWQCGRTCESPLPAPTQHLVARSRPEEPQ
jgi:nitroimidazol reductase NimA-like FMN-containing flavoprotein (pyridoxamine 5'-phosphate oxidase superfamily)